MWIKAKPDVPKENPVRKEAARRKEYFDSC
jgi:hypothetical protein